jgi:hypothetical protein
MCEIEKMREVRGMGKEEATLETIETRDETLVAQQELKKRAICVRIIVLNKFVKAFKA